MDSLLARRETAFVVPLKRGGGDSHLIYSFTCDATFITMWTAATVCRLNVFICGGEFQLISVLNSVLLSRFRDLPTPSRPLVFAVQFVLLVVFHQHRTSTCSVGKRLCRFSLPVAALASFEFFRHITSRCGGRSVRFRLSEPL